MAPSKKSKMPWERRLKCERRDCRHYTTTKQRLRVREELRENARKAPPPKTTTESTRGTERKCEDSNHQEQYKGGQAQMQRQDWRRKDSLHEQGASRCKQRGTITTRIKTVPQKVSKSTDTLSLRKRHAPMVKTT